MRNNLVRIPSLFVKSGEEDTVKFAMMLTAAKRKTVVRLTGGCGEMSMNDAQGLYCLFEEAFAGFEGAMLFGGTRMVKKNDFSSVVPGITEIGPLIQRANENCVVMGVVPRIADLGVYPGLGVVVSNEENNDFITILHPDQDACLMVQKSADQAVIWDAEYIECMHITEHLLLYGGNWSSLLIAYNGGSVTEKEIRATAALHRPVMLIAGSGRVCDRLAQDKFFLKLHPSVIVAEKNSASIREHLISLGVIKEPSLIPTGKSAHVA